MIVKAMRGAITPNFRMIALRSIDASWRLDFFFAQDDPGDRQAAREIREDLAASLDDIRGRLTPEALVHVEYIVTTGPGPLPLDPETDLRIIYLRNELRGK
jgi:hypothetical protein